MKQLFNACTLVFLLCCSAIAFSQVQEVKKPANLDMRGAYTLVRQVVNAGNGDSVMATQQLKLFTDKYMMYAHRRAQDSLGEYGIGTYKVENGKVIEKIFYTDAGPQNLSYELTISKANDGYSQVINFPASDQSGSFVLTEDYKKFGRKVKSPLDGAWKQTKVVTLTKDGKTTTNDHPTQFKLFESGNFIWANTTMDSATKQPVSAYGYGTFEMQGPRKAAETNLSSTFASMLVDHPVMLDLRFPSKDMYEQTITFPDGSKLIETYQRLK